MCIVRFYFAAAIQLCMVTIFASRIETRPKNRNAHTSGHFQYCKLVISGLWSVRAAQKVVDSFHLCGDLDDAMFSYWKYIVCFWRHISRPIIAGFCVLCVMYVFCVCSHTLRSEKWERERERNVQRSADQNCNTLGQQCASKKIVSPYSRTFPFTIAVALTHCVCVYVTWWSTVWCVHGAWKSADYCATISRS